MRKRILQTFIAVFLVALSFDLCATEYKDAWASNWHSSLQAACDAHAAGGVAAGLTYYQCMSVVNPNQYYIKISSSGNQAMYYAQTRADSCVSPQVWDSATQSCVTPPPTCDQIQGQIALLVVPPGVGPGDTFQGTNGCQYQAGSTVYDLITTHMTVATATGQASQAGELTGSDYVDNGQNDHIQDLDNFSETSNAIPGNSICDQNGVCVQVDTTTTTTQDGYGGVWDENGNLITISQIDGVTTVTNGTTTTTTYADGSSTVQTDTQVTTQSGGSQINVFDQATGGQVGDTIVNNSTQTSYTTSVTQYYNSSGVLTGTTTTSSGMDPGPPSGNCTPGNVCEVTMDAPTYAGQGPGDLYTPDDTLTYSGVLDSFVTRGEASPIFTAVPAFFTVSVSGSCPTWTIPSTWIFPAIPIDAQCSSVMNQVWPFIYAVIILAASWYAFRVAFGD